MSDEQQEFEKWARGLFPALSFSTDKYAENEYLNFTTQLLCHPLRDGREVNGNERYCNWPQVWQETTLR